MFSLIVLVTMTIAGSQGISGSAVNVGQFKTMDDCKAAANKSAGIVAGTPNAIGGAVFVCVVTP